MLGNTFGGATGVRRRQGWCRRRLLGVGHPTAFGNWLEDWLYMVDRATSETVGTSAGRYGVGRFERIGHHFCGDEVVTLRFLRLRGRLEKLRAVHGYKDKV